MIGETDGQAGRQTDRQRHEERKKKKRVRASNASKISFILKITLILRG